MTTRLKIIGFLSKPAQLEQFQGNFNIVIGSFLSVVNLFFTHDLSCGMTVGSTVQTIDQVLQNNLTLVTTQLNALEDQGNHDLLKTYGIEKCHVTDVR